MRNLRSVLREIESEAAAVRQAGGSLDDALRTILERRSYAAVQAFKPSWRGSATGTAAGAGLSFLVGPLGLAVGAATGAALDSAKASKARLDFSRSWLATLWEIKRAASFSAVRSSGLRDVATGRTPTATRRLQILRPGAAAANVALDIPEGTHEIEARLTEYAHANRVRFTASLTSAVHGTTLVADQRQINGAKSGGEDAPEVLLHATVIGPDRVEVVVKFDPQDERAVAEVWDSEIRLDPETGQDDPESPADYDEAEAVEGRARYVDGEVRWHRYIIR